MGRDFPIAAIPAPVWDQFSLLNQGKDKRLARSQFDLKVKGNPIHFNGRGIEKKQKEESAESHSLTVSFDLELPSIGEVTPKVFADNSSRALELNGVVYTTIFNPDDGRKNWLDILRMFCIAFREESEAILVVKLVHRHMPLFRRRFHNELDKLSPFLCQVVLIESFLADQEYQALAQHSTFVVNASLAEGQCKIGRAHV